MSRRQSSKRSRAHPEARLAEFVDLAGLFARLRVEQGRRVLEQRRQARERPAKPSPPAGTARRPALEARQSPDPADQGPEAVKGPERRP